MISELPPEADRADSPAREIFSDVANKWAFLMIEFLGQGTLRFSELRREVGGISHKMLTQNLRMLERNGLVERRVHPSIPAAGRGEGTFPRLRHLSVTGPTARRCGCDCPPGGICWAVGRLDRSRRATIRPWPR